MRRITLVILISALAHRDSTAQLGPTEIHSRVTEFIATRAPKPLPAGDTLVSWNGDRPVLFHTASRDSFGVRSGMLRADRMLGLAEVRWDNAAPKTFHVEWITPAPDKTDTLVIQGVVEPTGLRVRRSGGRDTVLAVPRGQWAVADYGMEELLLPAFDRLSNDSTTTVMVLRPYGMKWDSLSVIAGVTAPEWRVVHWAEGKERWSATVQRDHLLWVRRSIHPDNEKIVLEGTSARQTVDRLRVEMEQASRPSRPNEH